MQYVQYRYHRTYYCSILSLVKMFILYMLPCILYMYPISYISTIIVWWLIYVMNSHAIGANVVTRLGIPTRLTWLHTGSQHSWGSPFGKLTACHCCPTAACSCGWSPVLFVMLALCSSCRSRAISWKHGCKVVVIVLEEVHINNAHLAFLCFRHARTRSDCMMP